MATNIMIDLETLATTPDAAILSIGACAFNVMRGVYEGFYQPILVEWQRTQDSPRRFCAKTEEWWAAQSDAARAVFFDTAAVSLETALVYFRDWVFKIVSDGHLDKKAVWGNAPTFDCEITRHAMKSFDLEVPWNYWEERCFRTVKKLYPDVNGPQFMGVPHHAQSDAIHQARHLLMIADKYDLPL